MDSTAERTAAAAAAAAVEAAWQIVSAAAGDRKHAAEHLQETVCMQNDLHEVGKLASMQQSTCRS